MIHTSLPFFTQPYRKDTVYPVYKKVSFGANKVGELQTIRRDFLSALSFQNDVYVYIYEGGAVSYKATLIDEFLFYDKITSHPEPWGSWNINFCSYYTVIKITNCGLPLNKFKSFLTGKTIENVRRPLRVIEP